MGSSRRRLVAGLAVGLLPFIACFWGQSWLGSVGSRYVAGSVTQLGDTIAELTHYVPPAVLPLAPAAQKLALLEGDDAAEMGRKRSQQTAAPQPPVSPNVEPQETCGELPKPLGVFVSRDRVLAAAAAGIRPSGSPVPGTVCRPAGLALSGVGGLGVGLRDGDVLVIGGGPTTSEGAVVGSVIAALRRRAKGMSGVAWRGRQRILVNVELPELVKVDAPPSPPKTHQP